MVTWELYCGRHTRIWMASINTDRKSCIFGFIYFSIIMVIHINAKASVSNTYQLQSHIFSNVNCPIFTAGLYRRVFCYTWQWKLELLTTLPNVVSHLHALSSKSFGFRHWGHQNTAKILFYLSLANHSVQNIMYWYTYWWHYWQWVISAESLLYNPTWTMWWSEIFLL